MVADAYSRHWCTQRHPVSLIDPAHIMSEKEYGPRRKHLPLDVTYLGINFRPDIERPEHFRHGECQSLLRQRLTTAHAPPKSESMMASCGRIWTFQSSQVSLRSESVRFSEVPGITMDGPHIPNDGCALGNRVSFLDIVDDRRVRYASQNGHRAPPQRFLDHGRDVV